MLNHFIESLRAFFTSGSPLELGLLVVAVVAAGIALRVRALRASVRKSAAEITPPDPADVTSTPTARQWLARETAMNNDLPPLREPALDSPAEPTPSGVATALPPPLPPPFESRPIDDAIVFPTGRGFGDYRTVDLPPPRNGLPELPEASTIASILSEGLDDLATGGDRLAEAVRERPVQYVVGALAAGFVAGLMFPMVYGQQRVTKLLERLVESNEELKRVRLDERREARADFERRESERFRQTI
jgi:hypothetical protein